MNESTCGMCGQPIVFIGPHWQHVGELQPKHPAIPREEWEAIKVQNYPESDLSDHMHIDSVLVKRIHDARLGKTALTTDEITRLWLEICYQCDELRKARNSWQICAICGGPA